MTDKLLPLPEPDKPGRPDTFRGDDAALVSCINALLELDAKNALVPHGIGGHARTLLSSASARLTAHLAAQQAEPAPATDIDEAQIKLMTERGAKAWAGYEPAPVVGEPSEPLLRRMDAYLAGQSAEATAIIKDARAVLALRLQPASEPGGDFEQWLVDTARTPEAGVKPEQVNLMRIGWQAALRSQPVQAEPVAVAVFDEFKGRPVLLPSAPLLAHGDKLYATPPQAVPMTPEQVQSLMAEAGYDTADAQARADFINGIRHGERAHGITQPQQEGGVK